MKQRILVMNGQRIVQSEFNQEWVTSKVDKAGQIKPGIYDISLATPPSKEKTYSGVILHVDQEHVYQQAGKTCIRHASRDFPKPPSTGAEVAIKYDTQEATTQKVEPQHKRGLKR